MHRTITEFCRSVQNTADRGDLSTALDMIADFVDQIISRESSAARVFSSKQIDQLCMALGRSFPFEKPQAVDDNCTVFLVTGLHTTGGHSRVVRDLIAADAAQRCTILISGFRIKSSKVRQLLQGMNVNIEMAPKGDAASRLRWLQQRLFELRPGRTYILQHHHDPLCAAAAQPELTGRLFYYHNCDHLLALGVHLPHATHVDFNAKGYYHCRDVEGVANNVIWPLVADVRVTRLDRPFLVRGHLTTCTCGGFEKFDLSHLTQRIPYALDYPKTLSLILKTTGGTHIHIGELHSETINAIAKELTAAGVDQNRLIMIPYVPDLATALVENDVDIYMGSFPRGGGRATVEAMGASVPLIIYSNYRSIFFTDAGEAYPGANIWRTEDELLAHLQAMSSPRQLHDHSIASRAFFESRHTPAALSASVAATVRGMDIPAPGRPVYVADALQSFLDEIPETPTVPRSADHIRTRELLQLISKYLKRKARSLVRR